MKKIGWKELGFFLGVYVIILIIQAIGACFSIGSIQNWYYALEKAPWTPPSWAFGPAWTILYVLMAISIWIVFLTKEKEEKKTPCYVVFFLQLFFNFMWSILFFGLRSPILALVDIFILLFFIMLNIFYFYKVNKVAAFIMLPYIIWVIFATTLNFSIVVLN